MAARFCVCKRSYCAELCRQYQTIMVRPHATQQHVSSIFAGMPARASISNGVTQACSVRKGMQLPG